MDIIFGKKPLYAPESEIKFAQKTQKFIESGVENYFVKQKLTGDSAGDNFGRSLAINADGTLLMMGGNLDDDGGSNAGAALIYTGDSIAGWQLRQKLTGDSANDQFGWSVATNAAGTVLMMGGVFDDDGAGAAGAALVYTGSAVAGWQLRQKLTGDSANDQFGWSVATNSDGTVLVMGGDRDDDGGIDAGAALVYTGNAVAGWQLRQKLTGDSANDQFGQSVATNSDGTVLMMGGWQDDDGGIDAGAALVYTGNAVAGWQLRQKLTGDSAVDNFGSSVATNSDGTVLMMGGYRDNDGAGAAGAALVYTGSAVAGWQLRQKLTGDSAFDNFGSSVATNSDGTVLIMGGGFDDDGAVNAGAALVYTGNAVAGWQLRQKLTGDSAGDNFGSYSHSVAANSDGTVLIMGGVFDDDGGSNAGAALVYTNKVLTPTPQIEIKFINVIGAGSSVGSVGSLLFDDPAQFLQFSRAGAINITDPAAPFTIEAWIKPTAIKTIASVDGNGNPDPLEYGNIIIGDTEGGGNNWSLQLFNNKLSFYRFNDSLIPSYKFYTAPTTIPINEWTHVAVSYDGTNTLSIFINGVLDASFADYVPPNIQYSVITVGNLFDTGSNVANGGAYAYEGYITNLRINDDEYFYQMVSPFLPTAPLGDIAGTTLRLLANQNDPLKDSGPNNVSVTNVGPVTSSSEYPTIYDCANNDAKVLMVGWTVGPRALTRVSNLLYQYGDETVERVNTSSPWVYKNSGSTISTATSVTEYPWQAGWNNSVTATKICAGYVFVDPLPEVSNDDAYIRMNGWCSDGYGVGGNSERVLRPNHPQFQLPEEITVNGRLAYYTEIGGEKCIYNDTLNRWELLAMWYGNGDPNNPLLGVGIGPNIPYPFYATWTTYVDPVNNASIQSIEKVAVGTTKAPDPGPPCS